MNMSKVKCVIASEDLVKLITDYVGEYSKQKHPFLLFDLAHVNENDHTNVLMGILNYREDFLKSFLQTIGAPDFKSKKVKPTNQKPAIGLKGKGFIDLYFEYNNKEKVIVENKIYGAGDTEHQLARYIASAVNENMKNKDFEDKCWNNWGNGNDADCITDDDLKHIHVIYLTSDGSKTPDTNSLPEYFGNVKDENTDFTPKHINYYPVNYIEHIIPWLENDVLPNMPYSDEGIAIAGMRQYIASLKAMFSSKGNSQAIGSITNEEMDDKEKYECLMKALSDVKKLTDKAKKDDKDINSIRESLEEEGIMVDDLPALNSLQAEIRAEAMKIFSNDGEKLGREWKLYITPSFIILYKNSWAALDTRKYSIPSLYIYAGSTSHFLKNGYCNTLSLAVEHLNPKLKSKYPKLDSKFGNHDKNIGFELLANPAKITPNNAAISNDRKEYFANMITAVQDRIDEIDKLVEGFLCAGTPVTPDEILQEVVRSNIF